MNDLYYQRRSIEGVKKLKKISRSTILILEEAERLGIKWEKVPYTDLFKLTYKGLSKYFHAQIPPSTTELAQYVCTNKRISSNILKQAGVSVSNGYQINYNDTKSYRLNLFKNLKKPLVLKPTDDCQGNNVYINIKNETEYIETIEKIYNFYGKKKIEVLVEEMFVGDEYRILATQDKILSVIKRIPANVVGDGKSSIKELIKTKNEDPIRQKVGTYKSIKIEQELLDYLANQSLDLNSIPDFNKRVFLLPHGPLSISLGGDTIDVSEEIHSSVEKIIFQIMKSMPGLALAGIDYMSKDISKKQIKANYRIIEVNSSPSLDWNEFPIEGPHRRIAYEFLKLLFPNLD